MAKATVDPDGRITIDTGPGEPAAKATWDGEHVQGVLVKAEDERRYSLHVAYPADKADVAVALDQHRDFASKQAVEDAAWDFMKAPAIGLWHEEDTDGAGEVVESYIYRGPEWVVKAGDAEHTVREGDWMLGIRWSPETWALVKAGKIGGVSPQGTARRRKPSAEAVAALRS